MGQTRALFRLVDLVELACLVARVTERGPGDL